MEQDASTFASAVEEATDKVPTHAIQQLKGRFRFLWGMYKAHSEVRPSHCNFSGHTSQKLHGVSLANTAKVALLVMYHQLIC